MKGISKLPSDLLLDIFETGYLDRENTHTCRTCPFELQISWVSRLWHDLAVSLPRLWTRIDISQMPRRILEMYLERSRSFPLEVHLYFRTWITDGPGDTATSLKLELAAAHVSRWRCLAMSTPIPPSSLHSIACLRPLYAPILSRISISVDSRVYSPTNAVDYLYPGEPLEIFNQGMPCLTTLHLEEFGLAHCQFPIVRLTSLSLFHTGEGGCITKAQFSSFMLAMPNLRELSIRGDFVTNWEDLPKVTINAPSLCILRLWNTTDSFTEPLISEILLTLYCPKCHTLVLTELWEEDLRCFFDQYRTILVSPRYPVLRSLVFVLPYLSDSDFTLMAHAFPTITHLAILRRWGGSEESVPRALIKPTSERGEILWPNLKSLTLSFVGVQTLRAIVAYRKGIGRPLQKLHLKGVPSNWEQMSGTVAKDGVIVEETDGFEFWLESDLDLAHPCLWLRLYDSV